MSRSRREFLQSVVGASAVMALSPQVPAFLLQAAAAEQSAGERVLVVVQLSGGNDGLNTVIPYEDDEYFRQRFTLAIGREQVLKLDDYVGLHPALTGFSKLFKAGRLAVVQGVGYPSPNRSHFESMDLWHTAHRAGGEMRGWLGRGLDASAAATRGEIPSLHLGGEKQPLALAAHHAHAISVRSPEDFQLNLRQDPAVAAAVEAATQASAPADDHALLQFARSTATAAYLTSQRVESILRDDRGGAEYPGFDLARKLRTVANLIAAGLPTRVYYLSLDGFDTHSNQGDAHRGLLAQLGGSLEAFCNDLDKRGCLDRVWTLCFSEFGRRVHENASQGTDHGAAAPLFIAGGSLKGGVVGKHPSLTDLDDGDLKFHTDYRRVYATVLEQWLAWPAADVLGGAFEPLALRA